MEEAWNEQKTIVSDEREALLNLLENSLGEYFYLQVEGKRGSGKTVLIQQLEERIAHKFSAILWVNETQDLSALLKWLSHLRTLFIVDCPRSILSEANLKHLGYIETNHRALNASIIRIGQTGHPFKKYDTANATHILAPDETPYSFQLIKHPELVKEERIEVVKEDYSSIPAISAHRRVEALVQHLIPAISKL